MEYLMLVYLMSGLAFVLASWDDESLHLYWHYDEEQTPKWAKRLSIAVALVIYILGWPGVGLFNMTYEAKYRLDDQRRREGLDKG